MEHFTLACTADTTTFAATATARTTSGARLQGISFTVDETGAKQTLSGTTALGDAGACWARTIQGTC
jgi:hypothetical protein